MNQDSPTLQTIDRLAPTRRPDESPIGYQTWEDLLFVHWKFPAAEVQALLPDTVTVDTHDGFAWLGLVPFAMRNVRPWWSPTVPGVSNFLETNVRTYVHLNGADPGVWFFSLEASSSLAVRIARWKWQLPYFRAKMELRRSANGISYCSSRLWPEPAPAQSDVAFEFQESAEPRSFSASEPGTFEHFLLERYYLYTTLTDRRSGESTLLRGQVHHAAYEHCGVELTKCSDGLVAAAGFEPEGAPEHLAYSPGVDVEIFPLRPVAIH